MTNPDAIVQGCFYRDDLAANKKLYFNPVDGDAVTHTISATGRCQGLLDHVTSIDDCTAAGRGVLGNPTIVAIPTFSKEGEGVHGCYTGTAGNGEGTLFFNSKGLKLNDEKTIRSI